MKKVYKLIKKMKITSDKACFRLSLMTCHGSTGKAS